MPRCRGRHPHLSVSTAVDVISKPGDAAGRLERMVPRHPQRVVDPRQRRCVGTIVADHWAELSECENVHELENAQGRFELQGSCSPIRAPMRCGQRSRPSAPVE
jgi:hypothetical protein